MSGQELKWRSIRLPEFDYTQASAYAFTVVVHERALLLGEVQNQFFIPSPAGFIVEKTWHTLPVRFSTIVLDAFIVMPNHIHGIVFLGAKPIPDNQNAINGETTHTGSSPAVHNEISSQPSVVSPFMASSNKPPMSRPSHRSPSHRLPTWPARNPTTPALGEIIRSLKAASTTQIRKRFLPTFAWQPNYWDRIIRNDAELDRYRTYIDNNPARWEEDKEYLKKD